MLKLVKDNDECTFKYVGWEEGPIYAPLVAYCKVVPLSMSMKGEVGGGCLNRVVTNAVASNDGHTTRGSGSSRR